MTTTKLLLQKIQLNIIYTIRNSDKQYVNPQLSNHFPYRLIVRAPLLHLNSNYPVNGEYP